MKPLVVPGLRAPSNANWYRLFPALSHHSGEGVLCVILRGEAFSGKRSASQGPLSPAAQPARETRRAAQIPTGFGKLLHPSGTWQQAHGRTIWDFPRKALGLNPPPLSSPGTAAAAPSAGGLARPVGEASSQLLSLAMTARGH